MYFTNLNLTNALILTLTLHRFNASFIFKVNLFAYQKYAYFNIKRTINKPEIKNNYSVGPN